MSNPLNERHVDEIRNDKLEAIRQVLTVALWMAILIGACLLIVLGGIAGAIAGGGPRP